MLLTPQYLQSINLKKSSILFQEANDQEFEVGVIGNQGKLENLSLAVSDMKWTELTYITGENIIQSFYNTVSNPEYKNKFLFEAINSWTGRRQVCLKKNSGDPIVKINTIKTLKRINER